MTSSENDMPIRSYMEDTSISWRHGKPDYQVVDKKYMSEKTNSHKSDSMEKFVENYVKTWEMETMHKLRTEEWVTVDHETFTISVNHGKKYNLAEYAEVGSYNMLMRDSPLYEASRETYNSSQELFHNVFKNGFAWELLELLSGPPIVAFTWRHWGKWEGPYKNTPPTHETLEMYGSCVVKVTDKLKIKSIDVFYDPNPLLATLMNVKRPNGCPFTNTK